MTTGAVCAPSVTELTIEEIGAVSGGVFFVAPVLMKIGAWSLGAAFGAGGELLLIKFV